MVEYFILNKEFLVRAQVLSEKQNHLAWLQSRRWQGEILIKKKLKVNRSEANDKEKSFKFILLFDAEK